ncbi:hypothetical protein AGMMS50262_17970 [Bacteroidia bacterium]|nr:hypothetical protein AGMMS50262_17970 [Bacteroidia bacterium]
MNIINCFIPFRDNTQAKEIVRSFEKSTFSARFFWLTTKEQDEKQEMGEWLVVDSFTSSAFVRTMAEHANIAYCLLCTKPVSTENYRYAGLYDLRLKIAQHFPIVQIEMEQACTEHLKTIGAYLPPAFKPMNVNEIPFEYEISVIIPVRNRVRTIADAIRSVLNQQTNFKFNLIVVNNHSTDGTTEIIDRFTDDRLIHITPKYRDLGIGGCWNVGVFHSACGKFAVQLDSDDVYSDKNTLQKIVDTFYAQQCAMVVGTYRLTDFEFRTLPPGVIDHKEWTDENGRNNALRINGLGAPRAFYTPLLREIKVPNTSYGEDYALGLQFSREYPIGRIYDVLYLCRRWDDNSDAALEKDFRKITATDIRRILQEVCISDSRMQEISKEIKQWKQSR